MYVAFSIKIPNLSLYLCMVEFETEYKFEFETENKIFHKYQLRESIILILSPISTCMCTILFPLNIKLGTMLFLMRYDNKKLES